MKNKIISILMTIALLCFLIACDSSPYASDPDASTNIGEKTPINHDNPREDYSSEDLIRIINKYPNIKAAKDIPSDVPKTLGHVSVFECCSKPELSFENGLNNFRDVLGYLCPGRALSEACFSAVGSGDSVPIYENYDRFKSGEFKVTLFEYNESASGVEEPIYFYARSPVCSDLSSFNRGELERIVKRKAGFVSFLYNGSFVEEAEYIGRFSPDSEERFKLLDKETSIKEAVEFFENYVAGIPCDADSPFKSKVIFVEVFKINEKFCCFDFIFSREYDSISFDYTVNGGRGRRTGGDMSIGVMIKSNEVDSFYGIIKAFTARNETQYTDFISCEDAAKIVSDNMTEYTIFEVRSVRLLYCQSENIGDNGELGKYKTRVFPMWVFELYNANDGLTYNCYVNALNGEFEYFH